MKNKVWKKAILACADPDRAKHFLQLLAESEKARDVLERAPAKEAEILATLFSGSESLSTSLVKHPEWLAVLEPEKLHYPRRKQGLRQEVDRLVQPLVEAGDHGTALARLREFHQREMLRIAARDLARLGAVPEITQELSDLADVCLEKIWGLCGAQLEERYGRPYHQDAEGRWQPTAGCVLGMGKLGGQELNYSSDVDLMFVYTEEGSVFKVVPRAPEKTSKPIRNRSPVTETPGGRPTLKNHQFFNRLAEAFVTELMKMAPEGTLYRVDLRLRPEGDTGPLSRSLSGFENYYAQWGQTWERMMLIKARAVAGDESLGAEFLDLVQPFRYPRSISEGALREVGAMKDRIENEVVKAGELERNVKLGRGGIREIEFIAQSLQLIHAGRQPFLQGSQTLPALAKLVDYGLLPAEASRGLRDAYCFLREVEHRLQMEHNRQTHTIPTERKARERLARLMEFSTLKKFEDSLQKHAAHVRANFDQLLKAKLPHTRTHSELPREFDGAEQEWRDLLARYAFKDIDRAFRVLREFVEGPGYVHVSPRTRELALNLIPRLFERCPDTKAEIPPNRRKNSPPIRNGHVQEKNGEIPLSDPDRVVTRLDNFISAYGARATLFELWNSNQAIFDLLLQLFDRSEFLAELAIRTPDLVDELVTSGRLRQRKSAQETLRDLRHGLEDKDQHLWLRRYHQAELMRIGLRDILGLADFEQYLAELSALADACLQYALEVTLRRNRMKTPPFAIIGLGKLGGAEIDYGSDLDIIFIADSTAKDLPKLSRMAVQVMDLLSARTEQGVVFHTDARLRPDGEKGLLVNTLKAYEEYYRRRAQLWEIQTLTRTRPVAGNSQVAEQFQQLAATLTNFKNPALPLSAFTPDWKSRIHQMRMRVEKERTPRGKNELAIKTGTGGLMDAEFVGQVLCLEHGWKEANTLRALLRGRDTGALPDAAKLIDNYRRLRRVEGILRRWSYEGESVLPDDPAPYYRVSVRCGFPSPEAFWKALSDWRRAIREVYTNVISG